MESCNVKNTGHKTRIEMAETPLGGLMFEKQLFNATMQLLSTAIFEKEPINYIKKNEMDCIKYRTKGNKIYSLKHQTAISHRNTLSLYSQSIAAAPNKSQELATSYSSRSALLFRLKKYEKCINDCERSIAINNDDLAKAQLYIRKLKSFRALNEDIRTELGGNILAEIFKLNLGDDIKNQFRDKAIDIISSSSTVGSTCKEKENHELPEYAKNNEAPCSSSAISIKYNDVEGRHIVANRKIEPGELLVFEYDYAQTINFDYKYLFCAHCANFTWSSVPCDQCIYNVYCSNECKNNAWEEYHSIECLVLSHLYSLNCNEYQYFLSRNTNEGKLLLGKIALALRILIISVSEFGGIDGLIKEVITLSDAWGEGEFYDRLDRSSSFNNKKEQQSEKIDLEAVRTKGFTDGTFRMLTYKSIFSLTNGRDKIDMKNMASAVTSTCLIIYYLSRTSNFFGRILLNMTPTQMCANQRIKFIAALLLRNFFIVSTNSMDLRFYEKDDKILVEYVYGNSIHSFCSLFNHSCNPNTISFNTKDNETVVFANQTIRPGQQIFRSYITNNYTTASQTTRKAQLHCLYFMECHCEACKENWSCKNRYLKDILRSSSELRPVLEAKHEVVKKFEISLVTKLISNDIFYDKKLFDQLRQIMRQHSENFTVRSIEYKFFDIWMREMLVKGFGVFPAMPGES